MIKKIVIDKKRLTIDATQLGKTMILICASTNVTGKMSLVKGDKSKSMTCWF